MTRIARLVTYLALAVSCQRGTSDAAPEGSAATASAEHAAPAVSADHAAPAVSADRAAPTAGASGEAPAGTASGEAPAGTASGEAPAGTASGEAPAGTASGEAPAAGAAPYRADIEKLCDAVVRSGADQLPPGDRALTIATWLGPQLRTVEAHDYLIKIQPLVGEPKAAALEAEARRVGLPGCALAAEWRRDPP